MHKDEILLKLDEASRQFTSYIKPISEEHFFHQPAARWSIAQNVVHLITSAKMTRLVYRLPKFIVKAYAGKPNRSSRSYEELTARYLTKLARGGKASGKFDTKKINRLTGKEKWVHAFSSSMDHLNNQIRQHWNDEQLDQYLAPHPLLGKITLRELGYFTIDHIGHHQHIVEERLNELI